MLFPFINPEGKFITIIIIFIHKEQIFNQKGGLKLANKLFNFLTLILTFFHSLSFILIYLFEISYSLFSIIQFISIFIPVGLIIYFYIKRNPYYFIFLLSLAISNFFVSILVEPYSLILFFLDLGYLYILSEGKTSFASLVITQKMKKTLLSQGFVMKDIDGYHWRPTTQEFEGEYKKQKMMDLVKSEFHMWKIIGVAVLFSVIYPFFLGVTMI